MKIPKRAGDAPIRIDLEAHRRYLWCSCGYSEEQPFCNGTHKIEGGVPVSFTVEEDKTASICACKLTSNPPYCDGSHRY